MQRSGDEAEVLLKIDDIVITLTVDVRMGFKRKKLSNVELADMDEDTRVRIEKILDGLKSSRDFDEVEKLEYSLVEIATALESILLSVVFFSRGNGQMSPQMNCLKM